jgi:hypothetical protein
MDILDIEVSNKDLETLDADIRPAWKPTGMLCVVPSCPASKTKFPTYRGFADHWRQIHKPTKLRVRTVVVTETQVTTQKTACKDTPI